MQEKKCHREVRDIIRHCISNADYPFPSNLSTHTKATWRLISNLLSEFRASSKQIDSIPQLLDIGSTLTSASDKPTSVATKLLDELTQRISPEIVAAAVVLNNFTKGSGVTLVDVRGIPRTRAEGTLLLFFEDLIYSGNTEDPHWGYYLPQECDLFNLSLFGIGTFLSVPIVQEGKICGAIWLGVRTGGASLTTRTRNLLLGVAQHVASSLSLATSIQTQTEETLSERDFLLGISHDLRAPGNNALCALRELLMQENNSLAEEHKVRLGIVEHNLQEQLMLLSDVLDYTQYKQNHGNVCPKLVEPYSFLINIIKSFQLIAEDKHLKFSYNKIDSSVKVDPRHLSRIVSNLLSNALKYTDSGGISVNFNENDDYVFITVTDTGIGVPREQQKKLFMEFARLSNTHDRGGIGLGLALSKVLAEKNGGFLDYNPLPSGRGSQFTLGLVKAPNKQPFHFKYNDIQHETLRFKTILVADDDAATCRMTIRYISPIAEKVVPASSFKEAVELTQLLLPDLIICDFHLRGRNAFELYKEVSTLHPRPVFLVISGDTSLKDNDTLNNLEGIMILEKPVDRDTLLYAIHELQHTPKSTKLERLQAKQHQNVLAPSPSY